MFQSPMTTLVPPTEQRSRNMAAIRSKDTKPEMYVRRSAHNRGFRFRLHRRDLPGNPDLVFPKYRVVALVHGCYWHGHVCKEAKPPKTNLSYWLPKIARNMERDRLALEELARTGWHPVVIRECTLKENTDTLLLVLESQKAEFNGAYCS
jgi:DNA mismatch endonuclease (patch repair protein)